MGKQRREKWMDWKDLLGYEIIKNESKLKKKKKDPITLQSNFDEMRVDDWQKKFILKKKKGKKNLCSTFLWVGKIFSTFYMHKRKMLNMRVHYTEAILEKNKWNCWIMILPMRKNYYFPWD